MDRSTQNWIVALRRRLNAFRPQHLPNMWHSVFGVGNGCEGDGAVPRTVAYGCTGSAPAPDSVAHASLTGTVARLVAAVPRVDRLGRGAGSGKGPPYHRAVAFSLQRGRGSGFDFRADRRLPPRSARRSKRSCGQRCRNHLLRQASALPTGSGEWSISLSRDAITSA